MEELLPHYERELSHLRRYSSYFAERYPKIAGRLSSTGEHADGSFKNNMEKGLMPNMLGNKVQLRSEKPVNGGFSTTVAQYSLELDDDTFKAFAFKAHPMAYLDGGVRTWEQAADSGKVVLLNMISNSDMGDPVGEALGRLLIK